MTRTSLTALLALLLGACSGTSVRLFDHTIVEGRAHQRRETVRPIIWGAARALKSMDPNGPAGWCEITSLLHARLFEAGPGGRAIPDLVTGTAISFDGLTVTYTLTEQGRWHDHQPVTAADVVATWKRIENAPRSALRRALADVTSLTALDDHTVRVALARAAPDLAEAFTGMAVLPAHVLAEGPGALETAPIGAGPFRLVDNADAACILAPHQEWHRGPVGPAGVIVRLIPDALARARALAAGGIDAAVIKTADLPLVGDGERFRLQQTPGDDVLASDRGLEGLLPGEPGRPEEWPFQLWRARWTPVPDSRRR